MVENTTQIAATASAIGAAVFVGVFGWLYLSGALPLQIAAPLGLLNLVVMGYSFLLAKRASE